MKTIMRIAAILFAATIIYAKDDSEKYSDLEKRVSELEKKVADLEKNLGDEVEDEKAENNKMSIEEFKKEAIAKAEQRRLADLKVYSKEEIDEIEDLYQDAKSNRKTRKGQKSLKQLMKKYKRANRTGCAILILAGVLQGRKKEKYLLEAANEYHDCYFGNGVQIGPSALYQLLAYYRKSGDKKKAEEIRKEMNEKYPDSFDDNGYLIVPKGK